MTRTIGVLISGRGSNLQAILDAIADGRLQARVAVVISNRASAQGLERARAAGIETLVIDHRQFASREDFDSRVANELKSRGVELVCLAGFMRLVGPNLLDAFPGAMLNIHPSLLPAFPGLDAQRQALDHGVKVAGATVHLVTGELDGGPIVMQSAVPVHEDDTVETLAARILVEEHRIYPEAIARVLEGRRFRTRVQDEGSGRGFRTKVQDEGSGRRFKTKVQDEGSGQGFRTRVQDEGSGRSVIRYGLEPELTAHEFIDVLVRSSLAERRPVNDLERVAMMLRNADIIVTARDETGRLVGVSRAISDFAFCAYLSDLAVDTAFQRRGIGRELIRHTHQAAGPRASLILLAAPAAESYYPHIGMEQHHSCWIINRQQ
jgi:phosphoribosylglycinamide formyltransferase-1